MNATMAILPEGLRRQFRVLEKRLWITDTILASSGVVMSLAVSYLALFVSDRFWDTPATLRFLLAAAGWLGAAYFIWGWARYWIFRQRDAKTLSGIVQEHYRPLGDRLLGIVELADETKRPSNVSPELCRAAIRQVSEEAMGFDFRQAVATRRPRLYALGALGLCLVLLAPWVIVPKASLNAWQRWIWPGSTTARFTFVHVEDLPDRLVVARGEPFSVSFGLHLHPIWKPSRISAHLANQPIMKQSIRGQRVTLDIPGQTETGRLLIRAGDWHRSLTIEPVLRPSLRHIEARVEYPQYLGREPETFALKGETLKLLPESRVAFFAQTTRELMSAMMTGRWLEPKATESFQLETFVEGTSFQTAPLTWRGAGELTAMWQDGWGLTSAVPWRLQVQLLADAPPTVDCPGQASAVAMLEEEILEIEAWARDDFGLQDLSVTWICQKPGETNIIVDGHAVLAAGAPQRQELRGNFRLAPMLMHLPSDSLVTLRALAKDYYPNRAAAESISYRVYILSREEHARLVQQELAQVQAEIEELTRRQESLWQSGEELNASPPDDPDETRELLRQADEQAEISRKLDQLSNRTSRTLQEALRNKSIPTNLLQEWMEHAHKMREIVGQPMAGAAQSLQAAQHDTDHRAENLRQALTMERQAVQEMMELQRRLGPAMDRMLANTLAQRFRRVARTQAEIRGILQTLLPRTIGLAIDDVTDSDRKSLSNLAREEDRAREEAMNLQTEIGRFYERTVERDYGTVAREMKTKEAVRALGELQALIRDNVGAVAMKEATVWQEQFIDWADKLTRANEASAAASSGSGPSSLAEEAIQRLLALMRLRIRQMAMREHTRYLEEGKSANQGYREESIMLSLQQMFLREDVDALDRMKPGEYLPHAAQAMSDAENLLMKPRTDEKTVAAETDAVNLLESEIQKMMKNAQGSSLVSAMSMMMEMMGKNGRGATAGGNASPSPGTPGENSAAGTRQGGVSDREALDRLSGGSTRPVPAEFREAMQRYQKALESLNPSREIKQP